MEEDDDLMLQKLEFDCSRLKLDQHGGISNRKTIKLSRRK